MAFDAIVAKVKQKVFHEYFNSIGEALIHSYHGDV